MSFIYNWFFGETPEEISARRENEDKLYRLMVSDRLKTLLHRMKNEGVKTRRDLKHYIGYFEDNSKIFSPEKSQIQQILIQVGWMPLDPYFDNDDTYLNAKMILTDHSISLAIHRLAEPYNRDWCDCLAEDTAHRSPSDLYEDYQI